MSFLDNHKALNYLPRLKKIQRLFKDLYFLRKNEIQGLFKVFPYVQFKDFSRICEPFKSMAPRPLVDARARPCQ